MKKQVVFRIPNFIPHLHSQGKVSYSTFQTTIQTTVVMKKQVELRHSIT